VREKGFKEVVEKAWAEAASNTNGVLNKLNQVHAFIHEWDFAMLKQPKKRLQKAQRELQDAMNGPMNDENETKAKEAANLIEILLEHEEVHWAQQSRANWLHHGNRNTSFFHNYTSACRKKNFIKKLRDENNIWIEGTNSLKPHVLHYFVNLFTSEVQETDPSLLEKFVPRIDADMNDKLLAPFTVEDVRKTVFSIGDFKAPGPDGLHAVFYKKFWSVCGDEITQEVLQAINTKTIPDGWNDTMVVLSQRWMIQS
jgi:hypothetical protein